MKYIYVYVDIDIHHPFYSIQIFETFFTPSLQVGYNDPRSGQLTEAVRRDTCLNPLVIFNR